MASLSFAKAVVAVLVALGTAQLAPGATFNSFFNGCTEGGNISVESIPSHNGNEGAKLYGDCAISWETSYEEGSMVSLSVAMGGFVEGDPGDVLIPISWRFSIADIGYVPAYEYLWEVWIDRDDDHTVLGSGSTAPNTEVSSYSHLNFAGVGFWSAGITVTADVPEGSYGAFRLDIPQDSLDVNSPYTPPPPVNESNVPEPGSALLLLTGGAAMLLLRRR